MRTLKFTGGGVDGIKSSRDLSEPCVCINFGVRDIVDSCLYSLVLSMNLSNYDHEPPLPCKPRDGPAFEFFPDPLLQLKKQTSHKFQIGQSSSQIYGFGLGLVAGWPDWTASIESSYLQFIDKVKLCFDELDIEGSQMPSSETEASTIYLYPVESLHITVATLRAFSPIMTSTDDIVVVIQFWKEIIQSASARSDWPKEKIIVELENAQLGSTAGILLWREDTRCLKAMRACLQREVNFYKELLDRLISSNVDPCGSIQHKLLRESLNAFSIPDIVHTSFLRFFTHPKTDGRVVQRRFNDILGGNNPMTEVDAQDKEKRAGKERTSIHQLFEQKVEIATVRLVIEYYPYKLFPYDENQVIWDCILK